METKIIPFDLEKAKKIQAGEAAGTIKTKNGLYCKIVSYCDGTDFFVERKTEASYSRWCYPYTKDGRYIDGRNNGGTDYDLIIEVPDTHQFKVGDKVRVRPNETHSCFVKEYADSIGRIQGINKDYYVVIVTGAFQDQFLAEELELVGKTTEHEFKPFDRVLVRNCDDVWVCALFSHIDNCSYFITIGMDKWPFCIPYEGNEHLINTMNFPD